MGELKHEFIAKRSAQLKYEDVANLLKSALANEINITDEQMDVLVAEIESRYGQAINVRPSDDLA